MVDCVWTGWGGKKIHEVSGDSGWGSGCLVTLPPLHNRASTPREENDEIELMHIEFDSIICYKILLQASR